MRTLEQTVDHSTIPKNYEHLEPEQQTLIDRLENFQAPYVEEKLLNEGMFDSPEKYQEAFNEFKKYIVLVQLSGKKLAMTSKAVDAVWHQFILFTQEYHDFCNKFLGSYLHHRPNTSFTPLHPDGRKYLQEAYTEMYGNIPAIWNLSADCDGTASGSCGPSCTCNPAG